VPCQSPAGVDRPANVGGSGPGGAHPTPVEALQAFLAAPGHETLARSGYVELVEPDGTVTYGAPLDGGDGYVTLVSVAPADAGWVVEGWRASGC
jgi:hypothetical protein